ncbi:hypothetical protein Tsubulata_040054, partial [Turnera subulata]
MEMGQQIEDRVDAANELASLASENDRNKKMIVKEGGVLALLKLLKEGASPEAQIAAANALVNIATDDQETVTLIVDALVGVLRDSPVKVQIAVADLVARMAELDPFAQVEFMRENVTRPLLSLLSMDVIMEVAAASDPAVGKTSLQSILEMMETPEVKLKLKVSCAGALWKLSKGGLTTCRKITETKWLLCLAKIIEKEKEELRYNCLMTIAEITAVAESNADLRRAAFKTNSPAAKAVLGQLLRVIQEENDPSLQILAIRAIGCLARTFRTREARIMGPLVAELGNRDAEVATEAAIALGKFACPENFNCSEHSKAIIEFDGVPPLMRLLRSGDHAQRHGLVLLCYLALNAGNSRALEEARASNNFDGIVYSVIVQYPQLTGLIAKALYGFRNDPILAWVWSYICTVQMAQQIKDRVDAANELASLAGDNDRNKKMIVEEGGILPLLKLLKEGASPEAQIAAANALFNIATDQERVRLIVEDHGVSILVGVLGDSPVKVQIAVAGLVARMAELDPFAQEEFMRENVTRPLVSLLSMDVIMEVAAAAATHPSGGKTSFHSLVEMNRLAQKNSRSNHYDGSSHGGSSHHRREKEREMESPEVKLKLKITAVAESNADLRRAAFKTNSPAAKAVLDQLLRVILEESDPSLQIPAIRAIGCLARTFPARETRIMGPLVAELGNRDAEVATEAAIALGKFACPENFNCSEHSKSIIEFDGVPPLMRLLRSGDQAPRHVIVLLCYLALNAGNSKALEQARVLNTLEGIARSVVVQYPELKDLIAKAIHHLTLYQAGGHPHR